jgi:hypothetical protein
LAWHGFRCQHEKGVLDNRKTTARDALMGVRSFAQRSGWQLRALGRNPIIRVSDRLEAVAFLTVLMVSLLAIPFAARVEDQTYRSHLYIAAEQAHSRHSIEAVVLQGSLGMPTDFDTPPSVLVQWHEGARLRTEEVTSPGTVETGAPLTIWIDETGRVVAPPLTPNDIKISAISVGWTVWILIVVFTGLGALGVRLWLDRFRAHAWESALRVLAHNDDGWANRRA